MAHSSKSPEEQAIELIAPRKYHQLFTLPATDSHEQLKVTYSVCGEQGEDTPTIVFCGGMFGSRWQAPFHNWLAEKEGVRIIYIDRSVEFNTVSCLIFHHSQSQFEVCSRRSPRDVLYMSTCCTSASLLTSCLEERGLQTPY